MPNQQKTSRRDQIEILLILVLLVVVLAAIGFALAALATGNGSLWWGAGVCGAAVVALRIVWTPEETD